MKASNVPEDLIERVQAVMGWPATEAEYLAAAKVITDDGQQIKLMPAGQ